MSRAEMSNSDRESRRLRMVAMLAAFLVTILSPHPARARDYPPLFGTSEISSTNLAPFTKWLDMLRRYREEDGHPSADCGTDLKRGCDHSRWKAAIEGLRGLDPLAQIEAVNRLLNEHAYVEDEDNWGVRDYWETPGQFDHRDGDCEDFAIAKFLALRLLGFANDDLRIVVLQDLNLHLAHAILVVYYQGRALVLDNQIKTVVPADAIHHYRPVFSINETTWWLHRG
jgi:predicted transglutaminase-like cysteine proteinase